MRPGRLSAARQVPLCTVLLLFPKGPKALGCLLPCTQPAPCWPWLAASLPAPLEIAPFLNVGPKTGRIQELN